MAPSIQETTRGHGSGVYGRKKESKKTAKPSTMKKENAAA